MYVCILNCFVNSFSCCGTTLCTNSVEWPIYVTSALTSAPATPPSVVSLSLSQLHFIQLFIYVHTPSCTSFTSLNHESHTPDTSLHILLTPPSGLVVKWTKIRPERFNLLEQCLVTFSSAPLRSLCRLDSTPAFPQVS